MNNSTPWVEKYRPSKFDDIVLDSLNKLLLKNIIKKEYFPNLLFYGPPGTGKTTTIINLVNSYQEKLDQKNRDLMIHLNASDERGIDIIRNQINSFVNTKTLFNKGLKFVVLDEVDYMTKNAQYALKYLLQGYNNNVRFCLICNYISRIDEALQNEFVRLRFNQLPENDILKFLRNISDCEKINLSDKSLVSIQKQYNSDIRSMINYMQSNQNLIQSYKVIDDTIWENLTNELKNNYSQIKLKQFINDISVEYNIERKNIIKNYMNYIIRNYPKYITEELLNFIENIMHIQECNTEYFINYSLLCLQSLFKSL